MLLFFQVYFLFFSFLCSFFLFQSSNELESRYFVLPLNEISLEPSENVYTNLVSQNPLENPTNLATTSTLPSAYSTSSFIAHNSMAPYSYRSDAAQPSSYTTQSLTIPIKGIIPKLQREESDVIPIPGRAQSHDDIRMVSSGYSTPSYGVSPNSPRSQYMYGCSPNMPYSSSPPINSGSPVAKGGIAVARRQLSRATSPLSSSVPTSSFTTNAYKSSSVRHIAVSKNCSRSDPNTQCHYQIRTMHFLSFVIVAKI